jgi:hypothetical protein
MFHWKRDSHGGWSLVGRLRHQIAWASSNTIGLRGSLVGAARVSIALCCALCCGLRDMGLPIEV